MPVTYSCLAGSGMTSASATAQPTSNLRRIDRMERQLRIASMPFCPQENPVDPDTLDSNPRQPIPRRSTSTRLTLKRNLSQAFHEAKSSSTQASSDTKITAKGSFDLPSAPAAQLKIPFSQMLISHLVPQKAQPAPTVRTALNATQALRGTNYLLPRVGNGTKKDYSENTWSCEMCHVDFPNLASVTVHLRDYHAVESDVVTLTPDRDVITMVLASVNIDDEEHGWVDGNGEAIRDVKKNKQSNALRRVADQIETGRDPSGLRCGR